jgi:hypothetical protein
MSAGLGVYAATPGGGSLESRDISRMRRALVAGFIVLSRWFGNIDGKLEQGEGVCSCGQRNDPFQRDPRGTTNSKKFHHTKQPWRPLALLIH